MTERDLWTTLYHLKEIGRTGWLDRGIPPDQVESVADHSFFVMLIAWVVARDDIALDATSVLQLALIHDTAEALVGDIPPYDARDIPADAAAREAFFAHARYRSAEGAAQKRTLEDAAAAQILAMLPPATGMLWGNLWQKYQAQTSPEARFVKEVDRLEAFIQSRRYAERYPDVPLDGFTEMALREITHPGLVAIRDAFLQDGQQPD